MSAPLPTLVGWDARLAARAAGGALLAFVLVAVLTALTDEGGVGWGVRLGRSLPAVPLCAALGTYLALARRTTKRGALGLAALGRSPQRNSLGAVLGGAMAAWIAAGALLASPAVDVAGFFPSVVRAAEIHFEPDAQGGSFVMPRRAVRVLPSGDFAAVVAAPPVVADSPLPLDDLGGIPRGGRTAASLVTFLAGTALALLASTFGAPRRLAVLSLALALPATMLLFHATAAHRASAYTAALPSLALLAYAALRYRRWRWNLR